MAIDASQLTEYTWAQIATAAKVAMISAAIGGANYTINGRSFGRITVSEATKLYEFAIQMQTDESNDSPGGLALVRYGERV